MTAPPRAMSASPGPLNSGDLFGGAEEEDVPVVRTFKRRLDRRRPSLPAEAEPARENAATSTAASSQPLKRALSQPSPAPKPKIARKKQLTQRHLDLGQRNFHSTRCGTCGLVYTPGKESDDRLHAMYHKIPAPLRYAAASNDATLTKDANRGSIIRIEQTPGKESKLLKELSTFMEEQLGLPPGWLLAAPSTALLYVCSNTRTILGAIFAERITHAWTATSSDVQGSGEAPTTQPESGGGNDVHRKGIVMVDKQSKVRAQCGIRMMWTSASARRKGLATKLLDCARSQLALGCVMPREKFAFSQPTPEGTSFIQSYIGSSDFLVYGGVS